MEPILRTSTTVDWITILLFTSLLFMVMAKSMSYTRFLNFIILPFNNKYVFLYNKKDRLMNWFHVFFTLFQLINGAIFIYLARGILLDMGRESYPSVFLFTLLFLLLFLTTKVLLQLGNGYIFGSKKVISEILFKKLSYLNYSGILMFLANCILCYVLKDSKFVVYAAILGIILVNAIGWVLALRNHQKFIASYFFYFILYLCALEIAPLVIIGSYLNH